MGRVLGEVGPQLWQELLLNLYRTLRASSSSEQHLSWGLGSRNLLESVLHWKFRLPSRPLEMVSMDTEAQKDEIRLANSQIESFPPSQPYSAVPTEADS